MQSEASERGRPLRYEYDGASIAIGYWVGWPARANNHWSGGIPHRPEEQKMRRLCNETERAIGVTYCAFAAGLCHGCMSDPCSSVANELYMHDGAKSDYYFREQTYVLEAWK